MLVGKPRSFHMFCLPNPEDANQPGFSRSILWCQFFWVWIIYLEEMPPESAMTVDFATGLALDSNNPKPDIYQLQSNSKGHYVRDIVYITWLRDFQTPMGHQTSQCMRVRFSLLSCKLWNFIQLSFMTFRFQKERLKMNVDVDQNNSCWHFMQLLMENLRRIAQQPI